jgi:hypothetical protein
MPNMLKLLKFYAKNIPACEAGVAAYNHLIIYRIYQMSDFVAKSLIRYCEMHFTAFGEYFSYLKARSDFRYGRGAGV